MPAYIEIRGAGPPELFPLDRDRTTMGRDEANDVALRDDRLVSQVHAVIESYGSSITVRDLGSSNGTFVNGQAIVGERVLRPGDEIRLGRTQVLFRQSAAAPAERTDTGPKPPELTLVRALWFAEVTGQPGFRSRNPQGAKGIASASKHEWCRPLTETP